MQEIQAPSSSQSKAVKRKKSHIQLTIGAIVAILTPGAYLLGYRFHQGYLSAFGVASDIFPVSTPDVYINFYRTAGYFFLAWKELVSQTLHWLVTPPVGYWALGAISALVFCIYVYLKSDKGELHPHIQRIVDIAKAEFRKLHWKSDDFTRSIWIVGLTSFALIFFAFCVILFAVTWWLVPLNAYTNGQNVASERIKLYIEKGCHADVGAQWDTCYQVLDERGNVIHEGLLIAANDKDIAIFKRDGSYVFARQEGWLLRRKLH